VTNRAGKFPHAAHRFKNDHAVGVSAVQGELRLEGVFLKALLQ
jgi:hypothetical protein